MKQLTSLILAATIFLASCNGGKSKETTITSSDGKEKVTIDPTQVQDMAKDMQKKTEELQKLPPLTLDQLKALLPEELMGAKKTDVNVSTMMGTGFANAEYKINDTTQIKLNFYDCAGPAGSGVYSMQYMGMMNFQSENDNEYTKTVDFKGGKAIENCKKQSHDCTLTYFTGERYLVTLEGNNVTADELKTAAGNLNIK